MANLSHHHGVRLRAAMAAAFPLYSKLALLLATGMSKNIAEVTAPTIALPVNIDEIIKWVESTERIHDLAAVATAMNPGHAGLGTVCAEILADSTYAPIVPLGVDPFDVVMLRERVPFINRDNFRDGLRNLARNNGVRILSVNGPERSGKSHSFQLITFLATTVGTFEPILQKITIGDSLDTISYAMLMKLGFGDLRIPPCPNTTRARVVEWHAGYIATLIRKAAQERSRLIWLVVDVGTADVVEPEALALVEKLANLADEEYPEMRVILLGFRDVLAEIQDRVFPDDLSELAETELLLFFERVARQSGRKMKDAVLVEIVRWVMKNAAELRVAGDRDPITKCVRLALAEFFTKKVA